MVLAITSHFKLIIQTTAIMRLTIISQFISCVSGGKYSRQISIKMYLFGRIGRRALLCSQWRGKYVRHDIRRARSCRRAKPGVHLAESHRISGNEAYYNSRIAYNA